MGKANPVVIDYLPYLPPMQLEKVVSGIRNKQELENAKSLILSYYFSL